MHNGNTGNATGFINSHSSVSLYLVGDLAVDAGGAEAGAGHVRAVAAVDVVGGAGLGAEEVHGGTGAGKKS